jgi:hypothetical protein
LFAAILTSEAVGFVFVSAWSDRQPTVSSPFKPPFIAAAKDGALESAATNVLSETAGVTNAYFADGPFCLGLRERLLAADQTAKPDTKTVSFFRLPDGTMFTGDASDGVPSGWGIVYQPNGTRLEGDWRYGNPNHLRGIAVFSDGTVENGTWNYVRGTGSGTISWRDGCVYNGTWRNNPGSSDLPEGIGTMTWPDGHTYVGRFHNGKMHGQGKITYPNGQVVEGLWGEGTFMVARQAR